jgi:phospholipid/cholesterol/gamma-HCH transport system permease protein
MLHTSALVVSAAALAIELSPKENRADSYRAMFTWAPRRCFRGSRCWWRMVSLVVIHIVVVTAASYGLSQYALEMVVRVLVLELIPLVAALFVAVNAAPCPQGLNSWPCGGGAALRPCARAALIRS